MAEEVQDFKTRLVIEANVDKANASLHSLASIIGKELKVEQAEAEERIDKMNSVLDQQSRKALESRRQVVSSVGNVFRLIQATVDEADTGLGKFIGRTTGVILMAQSFGTLATQIETGLMALKELGKAEGKIGLAGLGISVAQGTATGATAEAAARSVVAKGAGGKTAAVVGDVATNAIGSTIGNAMDDLGKGSLLVRLGGKIAGWGKALAGAIASPIGLAVGAAITVIGSTQLMGQIVKDRAAGNRKTEEWLDANVADPIARWTFGFFEDLEGASVKALQESMAKRASQRKTQIDTFVQIMTAESAAATSPEEHEDRLSFLKQDAARSRVGLSESQDAYQANILKRGLALNRLFGASSLVQHARGQEGKVRESERRALELDALKREENALKKMIGLEEERLGIVKQQQSESRKWLETSKALATQWVDANRQALEAQKARVKAAKEEFGLSSAMDKDSIVEISRRIAGGQELTGSMLEFAKGRQNLFGPALSKIGASQADAFGFAEVAKNLGLTTDKQQAALAQAKAIEVTVNRVLDAKIQMDNQVMGQEMAKHLGPLVEAVLINSRRQGELGLQQVFKNVGDAELQRQAAARQAQ